MSESTAAGVPEGDQLAGSDQLALTAPLHERVIAKSGEAMKQQSASGTSTRRQTMSRGSGSRADDVHWLKRKDRGADCNRKKTPPFGGVSNQQ
jgi:hypothetical protein